MIDQSPYPAKRPGGRRPPEPHLAFNGKWRSYQQRILDSLDFHLRDEKLHIVAAPGAGKTTLGIEVIARLHRPTLILCPTNTIKNQWRERICSSFLQEKDYGAVSTRIRQPEYLTVTTYQALLAAFCGRSDEEETPASEAFPEQDETESESIASSARFNKEKADETVALLKAAGVSLLCFDEAHHLRKEWWKALTYLVEQLKPEQTLALTATPPYDADYGEWKRYRDLCGEIDEVISIPELVKNGDLCPHQDFLCFSQLKQHEREIIGRHSRNVETFVKMIQDDSELLNRLSKMKFFEAGETDVEMILESPEFYVSIASLLNSRGYTVPGGFLELFDARQAELPAFDLKRASAFINGLLDTTADCFAPLEPKKNAYFETARSMGLVANRKVVLSENPKIRRLVANSTGKLDSIVRIVNQESAQLQRRLRMVILTDYIRIDDTACQSVGVVPIWRTLKEQAGTRVSIGVLCGTLILLPQNVLDRLYRLLSDNKIAEDAVSIGRFDDDRNYVRVTPRESVRNHIVALITEMFCSGDLTVLIGTQALLGEGWDAPAINSLILSSTVSSYMLSNQMRGRAIRIDRNNPDKVSNIWHLATIDDADSSDLDQLALRFKGFEAPSYYGQHAIVSGLERITDAPDVPPLSSRKDRIARLEALTGNLSTDREQTRQWWRDSLYAGSNQARRTGMTTGVEVARTVAKTLLFTGYKHKIITFLLIVILTLCFFGRRTPSLFPALVVMAVIASVVFFGMMAARYLKTGTVEGVLKQIALALLETMSCQGMIKTSLRNVGLRVSDESGLLYVSCANLPAEENNLFIQSLQELLDPVDNPRYLLVRHGTFQGKVKQTDYFAVPALLSANRKSVDMFQKLWERYVGKCEVVYTRSLAGRKVLLKARKDASSAMNRERSKRLSKWQ